MIKYALQFKKRNYEMVPDNWNDPTDIGSNEKKIIKLSWVH